MIFFSFKERQNFRKLYTIQLILTQIILEIYRNRKNLKFSGEITPFFQAFAQTSYVSEEVGVLIGKDINRNEVNKYLKNFKKYVENIIDFYEKKSISFFPIYVSMDKSLTCTGFIFRFLNKYSIYDFQDNVSFYNTKAKKFTTKFYEYINILEKNKVLLEIEQIKDVKIGDIIVYIKNENILENTHIGFVYDKDLRILSKFGNGFIFLTPLNNAYLQGEYFKVYRINDDTYYDNFKNKLIPLFERLKLTKERIFKLIDFYLNEN